METKLAILKQLDEVCRELSLNDIGEIQWSDGQLIRSCAISAERGDPQSWTAFVDHLRQNTDFARGVREILLKLQLAILDNDDCLMISLPAEMKSLPDHDAAELILILDPDLDSIEEDEVANKGDPGVVMYIEEKPGLNGRARIGRIRRSGTGKTLYYEGRKLQSLKGGGYKANYFDSETGLRFWISNCRKGGNDTLYPGIVEIDDDAREEYWTDIRNMPENVQLSRFRSEGKYAKRRPS